MKKFLVLLLLSFTLSKLTAQSDMIGYALHKTLPQANNLNPALLPDYKFTLSLPGLAGFKANASQNFTNLTLLSSKTANGAMDLEGIYNGLRRNNRVTASATVPIFNLGIRSQSAYTAFTINTRSFSRFSFPRELVDLAYFGNATDETRDLVFDRLSIKSSSFTEIGLSHGREILRGKMTVGARVKYLVGHAYADISNFNLAFRTFDDDSIRLSTAGFDARAGGVAGLLTNENYSEADIIGAATAARGFGLDLGATFQFSEKINFFGSINDLGFINWKRYAKSYSVPATSLTFTGADLFNDSFEAEITGTYEDFEDDITESNLDFSSALTANIYVGGSYQLSKRQKAMAILYTELYKGTLVSAFTGMYNFQYNTFFNFAAGATIMNGRVSNIGTGFTLNLIPFQLCIATNDLLSILNPIKGKAGDVRVGVNFTFGNVKKSKNKASKKGNDTIDTIDLGID